jgi:putative ABC transport system permease protein
MFQNYLVTALRNIARHKLYAFINVAGLAVGLCCMVLIALFVRDEFSYDRWIPGSEKLWRVEVTFHAPGRTEPIRNAQVVVPLPLAMHEQIPEVRSATRLAQQYMTMTAGDRQFSEKVGTVDPNFLQVIALPLVSGNPATALSRPENLVISQSAARKYFGDSDPIGKTLTTGRGGCSDAACANTMVTLRVVGVMRDLPHNTQFDVDFLLPDTSLANRLSPQGMNNWLGTNNTYGYVTLAPGATPAQVLAKVKPILDRNVDISALTNVKLPGSSIVEVSLTPFRSAHLTTDRYGAMRPAGSWVTLYGMITIGTLILLVACFNFMNLATARVTLRAREISLRKCVGARRGQLVIQFLSESVMLALLALLVALALAEVLLPAYGTFMGRPLTLHYAADWPLLLGAVGIAVLAGLVSGFYPALVLSGFRPAATTRAAQSGPHGAGRLRTILVVLQFAVSIGLGIAALTVYAQINFARNIDLGFNRDSIVLLGTGGRLTTDGMDSYQRALERGPGILAVARSNYVVFGGGNDVLPTQRPGDASLLSPTHISVTPNYFQVYGIKIVAGRVISDRRSDDLFFSASTPDYVARNEGHNVMVNVSLARALGHTPADIIGKTFVFGKAHMRVVGVAADTLANGVRSPILQTIYDYEPDQAQTLSIRVQAGHTQEALAYINRVARSFVHGVALSPTLLDANYERLYQGDRRQGQVFAIFVSIAIFIACLGLFGLAAFTASRRTQEIGIRKVFGARARDIVLLLLWQFSVPVLVANAIAWPVAWYYLHGWLQNCAYRVALSPVYFIAIGLAALAIAWLTIIGHALRVARANPIYALRTA